MSDSNGNGRNNSGSFRVAGMVIPWPIIVFVVSVIANAAVAQYRIVQLEKAVTEANYHALDKRVNALELRLRWMQIHPLDE